MSTPRSAFYRLGLNDQVRRLTVLARQALDSWNIKDAELEAIKLRENAVFKVHTDTNERYVLRIHRYGYHSDAELRSELQWMQALHESGIETPSSVPTSTGEYFVVAEVEDVPEPRQVDMFEWVGGHTLGAMETTLDDDIESTKQIFRTIGELSALLHNQASAWSPPPGFVRPAWNVDGLTGEEPLWGRFWELEALSPAQRKLMKLVRQSIREELTDFGQAGDHYSLIHADLTADNLMVDGEVVRLIDFDDAGFGWHLFEIATSLYFHTSEDYFDIARQSLIDGYRSRRPLSDEQLEYLPLFLAARATTYLGWSHTRADNDAVNSHTLLHVERACRMVEEFLDR